MVSAGTFGTCDRGTKLCFCSDPGKIACHFFNQNKSLHVVVGGLRRSNATEVFVTSACRLSNLTSSLGPISILEDLLQNGTMKGINRKWSQTSIKLKIMSRQDKEQKLKVDDLFK